MQLVIGHHVDRQRFSADEWYSRPSLEKEDYAHRYAAERFAAMRQAGAAPFAPEPDPAMRQAHGLNDPWFAAP